MPEKKIVTERDLTEAGEKRLAAMAEKDADSYRELRAKTSKTGDDDREFRGEQIFTLPERPFTAPVWINGVQQEGHDAPLMARVSDLPHVPDAFDLAAQFLPEGHDVPWEEFVSRADAAELLGRTVAFKKMNAEGLLASLRANGAAKATGVPPVVRRLPRSKPVSAPPTPRFERISEPVDKPVLTSEFADLRGQVSRLEALVRQLVEKDTR